ncbi:hypothetical protein SAMN04490189_0030 [Pseudomonas koreensis]|nr:hypothetical protein SAMN04490189_0030 [Pseudomonas koreensis]
MVIGLAEANGETAGALLGLRQERYVGSSEGQVIFNIQGPHTDYGLPYAECRVFPALKAGKRYFQLKEVDTSDSLFLNDETEAE